jgi:alpha-soluble NSF attachment protein
MQANNSIEANQCWRESGKCYRHDDTSKAVAAYQNAIQMYLDDDRYSQAAKIAEEIGDMMAEDEKWEEAMKAFQQSADYFETENDATSANKRLEKMAMMAMKAQKYEKAIPVFERIAKVSVDNKLLRWGAKNHLFKACICHINSVITTNKKQWGQVDKAFERYKEISDLFEQAREAKLIEGILEALKKRDIQAFKNAVQDFDSVNPLERWTTTELLVMEKYLKEDVPPDLLGEDEEKDADLDENQGWGDDEQPTKAASKAKDPFAPVAPEDLPPDEDAPDLL